MEKAQTSFPPQIGGPFQKSFRSFLWGKPKPLEIKALRPPNSTFLKASNISLLKKPSLKETPLKKHQKFFPKKKPPLL